MKISALYHRYLNPVDHLVLNLEAALIFSGIICMLLNAVTFRYTGNHYLSIKSICVAPILLVGTFYASLHITKTPNLAFLLKIYSLYFLAFFAFLTLLNGIQYTPFPTVDNLLGAADKALLIRDTALIDWSYAHPALLHILKFSYHSVVAQWLVTPLLLFILKKNHQFYEYLIISLLAYLLGGAIYYFFPSVGPAGIFSDSHFNRMQVDTVLNYKEIHQYLMVTAIDGGMIAFPSFHVLWSIITVFALRNTPRSFFILLLGLNITAILSTLLLGWNYAVDITCGIAVAIFAIYLGQRLMRRRNSESLQA